MTDEASVFITKERSTVFSPTKTQWLTICDLENFDDEMLNTIKQIIKGAVPAIMTTVF